MKRADVCRGFYVVSDMINSAIIIFAIITLVAFNNPSFNDQLNGFLNQDIIKSAQEDIRLGATSLIVMALIAYVFVTMFGFFARGTLKRRTNHVWPHIFYLITSYIFLGINIMPIIFTVHYWMFALVVINFIFALVTAIFGMKVHNDV